MVAASWTEADWDAQLDVWAEEGLIERTEWCRTRRPLLTTPEPTNVEGEPGYVEGAWFDPAAVKHFLLFCLLLKHTIGRWAGGKIRLYDWQVRWTVGIALGWKHPDGSRIIRTLLCLIPRKNGKSTLASVVALFLWCADREPGAEVYAAAGDKTQAKIVYNAALQMAKTAPSIRRKGRLLRSLMEWPTVHGVNIFRALSADGDLQHGLNVHGGVIDELHVHKNRWLVDAVETGTGSREQPLIWIISTADKGEDFGIFGEKWEYIEALAGGHVDDPSTFGVIFGAAKDADPHDEETWRAANPGIGLTISVAYLRKESARAQVLPAYLNEFLRLHLNVRTKQDARWITIQAWDASGVDAETGRPRAIDLEEMEGRWCYAGVDLSSTTDLTSVSLWFPPVDDPDGEHIWVPFFWLPEDNIASLTRRTRIPFDRWTQMPGPLDGPLLRTTEGNVVDYKAPRELLSEVNKRWPIKAIGYDPWNATETATELQDAGFVLEPVRQGYATLSPAIKTQERLILKGKVNAGGNKLLRWNIDCAAVKTDENGNQRPVKPDTRKSAKRIDGWVSGLNAVVMHLRRAGQDAPPPEPRIRVIERRR